MEAVVWCTVPVAVHVDTDENRITRVVIIDEALTYPENIGTPAPGAGFFAVADETYGPLPEGTDEEAKRALELARGDSEWPSWSFGY